MVTIIEGDLFETTAGIICHQVNCQGVMGSGVALQVRQRYPNVYEEYRSYCKNNKNLLGTVLPVSTETNHVEEHTGVLRVQMIYNLFAQDNYGSDGNRYTSYKALQKCLDETARLCNSKTIAMPYMMSCHRGGGDWNRVYKMIEDTFVCLRVILYRRSE